MSNKIVKYAVARVNKYGEEEYLSVERENMYHPYIDYWHIARYSWECADWSRGEDTCKERAKRRGPDCYVVKMIIKKV